MAPDRTFRFRYGFFRPLLSVLGGGPRASWVTLHQDRLRVRMGWWFSADIPRSAITSATSDHAFVGGIGVHGAGGRWLVNGAAKGIVRIEIDPRARAKVLGVPVRLRQLRVSMEEPEALIAALMDGGVQQQGQHD